MPKKLNAITHDDYLRAEGAQMMLRLLCDDFGSKGDNTFSRWNGERYETAKFTPYQWLDAIRRFTAGVLNADAFLKNEDVVYCPVWGEKKGKPTIERIEIITKEEYDAREQQRQMVERP